MLGVGRVADPPWHLEADGIEGEAAGLAGVGPADDFEAAAGAGGRRLVVEGGELQAVGVGEVSEADGEIVVEPSHGYNLCFLADNLDSVE